MWIEAGLDPASFYTYTIREVCEIVAAKAKREVDLFKRDAQMQDALLHRLARKVMMGYHAPKDFPDYEPLDFGSDEVKVELDAETATIAGLRRYFTELKGLKK